MIRNVIFGMCMAGLAVVSLAADDVLSSSNSNDNMRSNTPTVRLDGPSDSELSPIQFIGGIYSPQCQADGAIYARILEAHLGMDMIGNLQNRPYARISKNGDVTRFEIAKIPAFEGSKKIQVYQHTVDEFGRVYAIVEEQVNENERKLFLLKFDKDGEYRSKAQFSSHVWPHVFLALPSGGFFIAGTTTVSAQDTPEKEGVTNQPRLKLRAMAGIFDDNAQLVRKLKAPALNAQNYSRYDSMALGQGQLSRDGSIYILKSPASSQFEVLTEAGEKVRTFTLAGPKKPIQWFGLAGDKIFVSYHGEMEKGRENTSDRLWGVFTADGRPFMFYQPSERLVGEPACFREDTLVLLKRLRHRGPGRWGVLNISLR